MAPGVEARGDLILPVQQERIGDAELLTERTDGGSGLPDAYADDRKPLGTEPPVEQLLGGQLPPTLWSPGGEEREEDNLSPKVAKAHGLPLMVGEGEVRCFLAPLGKDDLHGGKRVGCQSRHAGGEEGQNRECGEARRQPHVQTPSMIPISSTLHCYAFT